jgi:hypothetical protein
MSQPFTDTTTLRLTAPLLIIMNEGAETGLFELQLGSVKNKEGARTPCEISQTSLAAREWGCATRPRPKRPYTEWRSAGY